MAIACLKAVIKKSADFGLSMSIMNNVISFLMKCSVRVK